MGLFKRQTPAEWNAPVVLAEGAHIQRELAIANTPFLRIERANVDGYQTLKIVSLRQIESPVTLEPGEVALSAYIDPKESKSLAAWLREVAAMLEATAP